MLLRFSENFPFLPEEEHCHKNRDEVMEGFLGASAFPDEKCKNMRDFLCRKNSRWTIRWLTYVNDQGNAMKSFHRKWQKRSHHSSLA